MGEEVYEPTLIGPDLTTDNDRINFLQNSADPSLGWICRGSSTGRGLRVHQCTTPVGAKHEFGGIVRQTLREAIDDYMKEAGWTA